MFEYYGNIHVCCPEVEANAPGVHLFSESLIFSPTAYFLQDFPVEFNSFPHSKA